MSSELERKDEVSFDIGKRISTDTHKPVTEKTITAMQLGYALAILETAVKMIQED